MVFDRYLPPKFTNINRALDPSVRRPISEIKCCICGSDKVFHIGGIKDFWLCFKCHTKLIVKEEEQK
jgi:hypothetical protein